MQLKSVTWTLTQEAEQMLNMFERKILQRIYGPTQGRGGRDTGAPDGTVNSIIYTMSQTSWSHNKNGRRKDSKKGFKQKLLRHKPVERPRNRWADVVQRDALQLLGIRGWRRGAENRDEWRHLMREAKVRKGL